MPRSGGPAACPCPSCCRRRRWLGHRRPSRWRRCCWRLPCSSCCFGVPDRTAWSSDRPRPQPRPCTPQGEAALPSAAPGEEGSEPAASAAAEEAPLTFPTTEVEAPPPAAAKRKPRPAVKPKRRPKPAARRAPKPKPRRAPVAKRRAPPKPRPAVVIPDVPPEPTRTAAWAPAPAAAPTPLAALRPPPAAAPKDAPVDLSRPTKAVIAARAQSAAVARALRRCACEDAKARAEELQSTPEGRLLLRTLRPRVSRCQVPDVDERCVDGRVVD